MGMKLGMLLIREGAISPQQLEEALRLQVLYGGRLGTNLIELNAISADTLAQWLSRTCGFPPATEAMLEEAPLDVIQLLPSELAERHECFPFKKDGRRLLLAMTNPADLAAVDAISFKTGHRIVPYVVPELVLYFHLEKRYGIVRKLRYIRLSSRLEHGAPVPADIKREAPLPAMPPLPAAPPPASIPPILAAPARVAQDDIPTSPVTPVLKVAPSVPPPSALNARLPAPSTVVTPAQRPSVPPRAPSVPPAAPALAQPAPLAAAVGTNASFGWDAPTIPPAPRGELLPPATATQEPVTSLSLQEAINALGTAASRDEVAETLLRFATDRISTMLLFVVKEGLALGWKGRGPGLDAEQIGRLMLPLNVPSLFGQAAESRKAASGPVAPTDLHKHFYKALRREPPAAAVVVPVLVKERAVNLIYVDGGPRGEIGELTAALDELAAQVPAAYTRLLRESKRPPVRAR